MKTAALRNVLLLAGASVGLHGFAALALTFAPVPQEREVQIPIEIALVEPAAPPPAPAHPAWPTPAPRAMRGPTAIKLAHAPRPALPDAPPPPKVEATTRSKTPPLVVSGITLGSTSSSGAFAVGAGNTLYGKPAEIAIAASAVKPTQAERYLAVADLSEPPAVAFRADLKKFYPTDAQKEGFEGDVVLGLFIDRDGSIAKVELLRDPGHGLGAAGTRAIREFRFKSGRLNGVQVAATVTFVLHFLLQ